MNDGKQSQPKNRVTDSDLLERVRDSDAEAFRTLFDQYQPLVFRHVLYQTRDVDLAHDIVQESFLRIWERRASLKPHLSFVAYLFRISGNLVRDDIKHRNVQRKLEHAIPPPTPSEGDDPEEALRMATLKRELVNAVNVSLPEKCRTIFLLSRMEGKSNKQIAELLGIATKTVENQLHHALKVLRKRLRGHM
jgi:RNA polymerase sigma-70 factor (ECF subfamily)